MIVTADHAIGSDVDEDACPHGAYANLVPVILVGRDDLTISTRMPC